MKTLLDVLGTVVWNIFMFLVTCLLLLCAATFVVETGAAEEMANKVAEHISVEKRFDGIEIGSDGVETRYKTCIEIR